VAKNIGWLTRHWPVIRAAFGVAVAAILVGLGALIGRGSNGRGPATSSSSAREVERGNSDAISAIDQALDRYRTARRNSGG